MSLLKELYKNKIAPKLVKELKCHSIHEVPKLTKITLNMALGKAVQDPKIIDEAVDTLSTITGQKPLIIKAQKSVAAFKLRKGKPIGCKVTLRGQRMYEFLERLVTFTIPRIKDFRGLSPNSFDGRGNYAFGVTEQGIFPEIKLENAKYTMGMDIIFSTTAKTDKESLLLLKAFGMPFKTEN